MDFGLVNQINSLTKTVQRTNHSQCINLKAKFQSIFKTVLKIALEFLAIFSSAFNSMQKKTPCQNLAPLFIFTASGAHHMILHHIIFWETRHNRFQIQTSVSQAL